MKFWQTIVIGGPTHWWTLAHQILGHPDPCNPCSIDGCAKRPPTAFRKSNAEEWVAPCVSNTKGWKVHVSGRSAYSACFLFAAASAALPADWDDRETYEADYRDVPGVWFTGLPRNESQPIWTLAIGSRQAARLFAHCNTCRCQRACYCIVDVMVPSCPAWCLFTHQAMKAVGVHQRSTATSVSNTDATSEA